MSGADYENCWFIPWVCPIGTWLYNKVVVNPVTGVEEKLAMGKYSPSNLCDKECLMQGVDCNREIALLVTSEKFTKLVGAEKRLIGAGDPTYMDIMEKDPKYSSHEYINEMLAVEGGKVLILSGEGDYIVPWRGMWEQMTKNWTVPNKKKLLADEWGTRDDWYFKKQGNFEWRRVFGAGHLIFVGSTADVHTKIVTEFMDECYRED